MRTHNLTKTSNTLLILLAFACIGYSWLKLEEISSSSFVDFVGEKIGVVAKSKNDVRRKSISSFSWVPTNEKTEVSENDSIFTNNDSQAFIKLENESEITIAEQSLVHFENQNSLKIENGKLDITISRNSKPLNIIIGRKKISLSAKEASSVSIQKNHNSGVIAVTKGNLNITTEKSVVNIGAGKEIKITSSKVETSFSGVELLSPRARVELKRTKSVEFDFKSPVKPKSIYVSRSDKEFFLKPGEKINLRGDYYKWGLVFKGEVKPSKLTSFSLIKKINAPKAISPKKGESFNVEKFPITQIFNWDGEKKTIFEFKKNDSEKINSQLVEGNKTSQQIDSPGEYSWRLKSEGDFLTSDYGGWQSFSIQAYTFSTETKTIVLNRPNQKVAFSWGGNDDVQFILARDQSFSDIVKKMNTNQSRLEVNIVKPGTYYWKLNSMGKIEAKKVIIIPSAPPKRAPKVKRIKRIIKSSSIIEKIWDFVFPKAHAGSEQIYIDWEEIKNAKVYEIEISKDEAGKDILFKTKTSKPYIMWDAPKTGVFYYRVRYQDFWQRFSPYSEFTTLEIVKKKAETKHKLSSVSAKENIVTFFYQASQIDFEQDEASVEGTSTTGHGINIQFSPVSPYEIEPWLEYSSQYGKVFDSQEFVIRGLELGMQKEFGIWKVSAVMALAQLSEFEISSNEVNDSSLFFGYSLGGKLGMPFNLGKIHEFEPFFTYVNGSVARWQLGLSYQYSWGFKYIPQLRISRNSISIKDADVDIKSEAYLLSTGLIFAY